MGRFILVLGILVAVAAALWWLMEEPDERVVPGDGVARDRTTDVEEPTLEGTAPPDSAPETATARGPASISGVVRRDGEPAQARVEVRILRHTRSTLRSLLVPPYADEEPVAVTESGDDGTFLVKGLVVQDYEVTARDDDGRVAWDRVFVRPTRPHGKAWLVLRGGDGVLAGRAERRDGTPFRGSVYARVQGRRAAQLTANLPHVATDPEGRFQLTGLPNGEIALVFLVPDELRSMFRIVMPVSGEPVFVVDDGVEAREGVVVVDGTGVPIADADVVSSAYTEDGDRAWIACTTTKADGTFPYGSVDGRCQARVEAAGFEPGDGTAEEGEPLEVRLKRRGIVTGRVVAKDGGAPVGGVPVHGWNWYAGGMLNPRATTAEDGTFTAEVGPGRGMLYVLGGGWASVGLSDVKSRGVNPLYVEAGPGETTEVVLEVVPTGRAEGTVRSADGVPLAGVAVVLAQPRGWDGFRQTSVNPETCSTSTDDEGRFAFADLVPTFSYHFEARPAEGLPARSEVRVAAPGETIRIELQVPLARWLPVRVVEKGSGRDIEGASVSSSQVARHTVQMRTGADGTVRLGPLLPDVLTLNVHHPDYLGRRSGLPTRRGTQLADPGPDAAEYVVELERGHPVAGRVRGVPAVGDEERYLGIYPPGAPTERGLGLRGLLSFAEDGPFRFGPMASGSYDIALVEKEIGFNYRELARWTVEAGRKDLVLDYEEGKTEGEDERFLVKVTDAEGRPVARAWVRVFGRYATHVSADFVREGEFVLKGVRWGGVAWIDVIGAVNADGESVGGVLHGPVPLEPSVVEIQLAPPATLDGQIVDPNGKPLAGLLVHADAVLPDEAARIASTFALQRTRTDEHGRFAIPGLGPGPYRVLLEPPDAYALKAPLVVHTGQRDVVILLEAGLEVEVRVLDPADQPLEGAKVKAALPAFAKHEREATTNADGVARIKGLDADTTYELTIELPVGRTGMLDVYEPAWHPAPTELRLRPGDAIEGTVKEEGVHLPYATVWWKDARGHWRRKRAGPQGEFQIRAAPNGKVAMHAARPNATRRDPAAKTIEVKPGKRDVMLEL